MAGTHHVSYAPVPRNADPQRYLASYSELRLPAATALHLGVVDLADGRARPGPRPQLGAADEGLGETSAAPAGARALLSARRLVPT